MRHLIIALATLATTFFVATSTPAATVFATPSTLDATLKAAQAGDTVILAGSAPFGPSRALTRKASIMVDATGAVIDGAWYNSDTDGITLVGGTWRANVRFDRAANLVLLGGLHQGSEAPDAAINGVTIIGGRNVAIEGVAFTGWKSALSMNDVDGYRVANSTFDRPRADGMVIGRSSNGAILDNRINLRAVLYGADHPDGVQLFGDKTAAYVVRNVEIARNSIRGVGQGIFQDDGPAEGIFVHHNNVLMGLPRGISVNNGAGNRVEDNLADTWPGATYQSRITTQTLVKRCGNVIKPYWPPGASRPKPGLNEQPCAVP